MEIAIGILYDFVLSFHGFYAGRTHDVVSEHYYIPLNFPLQPNFFDVVAAYTRASEQPRIWPLPLCLDCSHRVALGTRISVDKMSSKTSKN
jgi:hypothetical protein